MANLTDSPQVTNPPAGWVQNEIYKMDGADQVEGAAVGAAFGGLGVDNEPHQQLANRTALLCNLIQSIGLGFQGAIGANGWIRFPVWTSPTQQTMFTLEWGSASGNVPPTDPVTVHVAWPRPFAGGPYVVLAVATAHFDWKVDWYKALTSATTGAFRLSDVRDALLGQYAFAWVAIGV